MSLVLRAATHTSQGQFKLLFEAVAQPKHALTLDRDDQLRNHGEHLGATLLKHVEDALHREEAVGVLLLANALEEDGQVVVVVKLHDIDLPEDAVLLAVLNRDGQVTAVVEATELAGHDGAGLDGTSTGLLHDGLGNGLEERGGLATDTLAFLEGFYARE